MFPKYLLDEEWSSLFFVTNGSHQYFVEVPKEGHIVPPEGYTAYAGCLLWYKRYDSEREATPLDYPPGLGYKALASAGAYIPHKIHHVLSCRVDDPIIWSRYKYGIQQSWPWRAMVPNSFLNNWNAEDPFFVNLRDKAVINLYGSLARRQRLQMGVFIGELRETLDLLGKTVLDFFEFFNALRRGRIRDAIAVLRARGVTRLPTSYPTRKTINKSRASKGLDPLTPSQYSANAWLELQFGWFPLLKEIYDIIEFIQKSMTSEKKTPWFSFSGYAEGRQNFSSRVPLLGYQEASFRATAQLDVQREYKLAVNATFKMSSASIDAFTSIGLSNPFEIAWDLMPLSFVLDWFLPIGDWIGSFTAHAGLDLIEVTPSIKRVDLYKWHNYSDYMVPVPSIADSFQFDAKVVEGYSEEFYRIPGILNSLPPFPQRTTFSDIFQPWKLITAAALIKQLSR